MPTYGPRTPTAAANNAVVGTVAWTNPTNSLSSNNQYATATLNNQISQLLQVSGFGFTIPANETPVGYYVELERQRATIGDGDIIDNVVTLMQGTTPIGTNHAIKTIASAWPTSDQTASFGGATDSWDTSITYADVNDPSFGVGVAAQSVNATDHGHVTRIDMIRITVYTTVNPVLTIAGRLRKLRGWLTSRVR